VNPDSGTQRRALALALSALLLLAAAACGGGSKETTGRGQGQVVAVDPAAGTVTLDHGDIPGIMGAMTMTFPVSDPKLLEGIEAGQKVTFVVRYADGKHTVTELRPEGG
jgi:Cu(I)/Ag(I) efflux system protein CusF